MFSFNRLLLDKESLEQKHLDLLQVSLAVFYARTDQRVQEVKRVRTAKWQYTRTWEEKQDIQILKKEIEHLKAINCQENKKHTIDHDNLKDLLEKQHAKYFDLLQRFTLVPMGVLAPRRRTIEGGILEGILGSRLPGNH